MFLFFDTITKRSRNGSLTIWGRVSSVGPPHLAMLITIELSKLLEFVDYGLATHLDYIFREFFLFSLLSVFLWGPLLRPGKSPI